MATKIDLGHDMPEAKVDHLPPSGPKYNNEYQKEFHYRGKLFCSTANRLRNLCQQPRRDAFTESFMRDEDIISDELSSRSVYRPQTSSKPSRPRRIQSAKGRLEKRQDCEETDSPCLEKSGSQVSVVDMNLNVHIPKKTKPKRPQSASFVSPPKSDRSGPSSTCSSRPCSAKSALGQQVSGETVDNDGVKPSVFGLKFKRQVFGSDPGIFSSTEDLTSKGFPYVLSGDSGKTNKDPDKNIRSMPACLEPLRPWLNTNISKDVIGVDPATCLVFLAGCFDDLPEVPPPQGAEDVLACHGQLPLENPAPHKKYSHPFYNRKLPAEWECNHRCRLLTKICTEDGTVLHVRYEGSRTADVVRKEVQELENLLLGIGSYDSECMMVQYQADITRLREMVDTTLSKVPDRIKNPPEPPDTFGLRKFCKEHDKIVQQIKDQHRLCIQELAMLESGMDLEETQKYFSNHGLYVQVPS
ncbi:uncharacterized protein LOC124144559 [Haliotis rufescens]|uniref:uncharacterized protein LOC124144559 n=1 Tax=Haliotis rufescens TaxID=6454 RepID=UPI00201F3950|nr:uncharacterized protein LOC124144559 [Haliotis rufescens]